jgi:hypothetical protein
VSIVHTSFLAPYLCPPKDPLSGPDSLVSKEFPAYFGASSLYSPECVEDECSEVRLHGVLGSSA